MHFFNLKKKKKCSIFLLAENVYRISSTGDVKARYGDGKRAGTLKQVRDQVRLMNIYHKPIFEEIQVSEEDPNVLSIDHWHVTFQ